MVNPSFSLACGLASLSYQLGLQPCTFCHPGSTSGRVISVSHTSVHKVLIAKKFHPYKIQLVYELNVDDFNRSNQFCELTMKRYSEDPHLKNKKMFPDEALISLNSHVNIQSSRY